MIGGSIVSSPEDGLDKLAKHARGVLVLLAIIQLAGGAILYLVGALTEAMQLGTVLGLGVIFASLAVWARSNPLPAVLVGLGIWVTDILLATIMDPASLYNGLIMKVVVAALFWNGVSTGLTYNEMKRTLASNSTR